MLAKSGIESSFDAFKKQPEESRAMESSIDKSTRRDSPSEQQCSSGWQQPGTHRLVPAPGSLGTLTIAVKPVLERGHPWPKPGKPPEQDRHVGAFGIYSEQSDVLQFANRELGFSQDAKKETILKHLETVAVQTVIRKLCRSEDDRHKVIVTSHSKVRLLVNHCRLPEVVDNCKREFHLMEKTLQAPHILASWMFFGVPVELEAAKSVDDHRYVQWYR